MLPCFYCQQPFNIVAHGKFSPAKDPCSILWDVMWDDLVGLKLTHRKKDNPGAEPSRLVLSVRHTDMKEQIRKVKCKPGTTQAFDIHSSIERAMTAYGPDSSKVSLTDHLLSFLCC